MNTPERLRGLDAAFLYLETPTQFMHVSAVMILEPAQPVAEAGFDSARLADVLLQRLVGLPAFRRRLADAPLQLTHPAWIPAAAFRPRDHVKHARVCSPGTGDELAQVVARIAEAPLDRTRPLWELWAIDGLQGGRVAFVLKVHHAMLDGVSGLEVLAHLFTAEPDDAREAEVARTTDAADVPSSLRLAASLLALLFRGPVNLARTLVRTGRSLLPLARSSIELARANDGPARPFLAARTILNHALTSDRAVAFGQVPFSSIRRLKNAFGVTVNDVVLAACTLALREYLAAQGERPRSPLTASIPISEHAAAGDAALGNRVSAMFVALPVHLETAADVVGAIHRQSVAAKKMYDSLGRAMLADWIELAPPALFAGAAGLYSRWKLAELLPPVHSVVVSNVPGPPMPVYAGGARLVAAYPLGPILEGAALNISVLSYAGSLHLGLIACPDSVARPSEIVRAFERAVADLEGAAAAPRRASVP